MSHLSTHYVNKEEALQILNISTRTLERYIKKYRLKTRKDGRRILIKRNDVDRVLKKYMRQHDRQINDRNATNFKGIYDTKKKYDNMSDMSHIDVKNIEIKSVKEKKENPEVSIYKDLYADFKKDLKEKQERLEAATYRVGQLEAQLKNTVPLLDYTRKEKEIKDVNRALEQKAIQGEVVIKQVENKLYQERLAKWVYLSLVGLLLAAQPIIFIWWALS